ncbi:MAG: hypothetical protein ACLPX5_06535 [Dissulfurispiraceae bacterium]
MKHDGQRAAHLRLSEAGDIKISWTKWGLYFSERWLGTVRKDYSEGDDVLGEE